MRNSSFILLLLAINVPTSWAIEITPVTFDLNDFSGTFSPSESALCHDSDTDSSLEELVPIQALLNNPVFWSEVTNTERVESEHRLTERTFYVFPSYDGRDFVGPHRDESATLMGLTQRQALNISRDSTGNQACSTLHLHDDVANRWCHSAIAETWASFLRERGLSNIAASIAGGLFFVPKEYLMDLNPSANDLVFTYGEDVSNRVSYRVTVFGDVLFPKRIGEDFSLGSGSLPFVTLKLCLGSAEQCPTRDMLYKLYRRHSLHF